MSIRIGNSCINCENLLQNKLCSVHGVHVNTSYTCDSFSMRAELKEDSNCETCARYQGPTCAHPLRAAPAMLCSHWAPKNASA